MNGKGAPRWEHTEDCSLYGSTPIMARTVFAVLFVVHDINAASPIPIDWKSTGDMTHLMASRKILSKLMS